MLMPVAISGGFPRIPSNWPKRPACRLEMVFLSKLGGFAQRTRLPTLKEIVGTSERGGGGAYGALAPPAVR